MRVASNQVRLEAAMAGRAIALIFASALLGFAGGIPIHNLSAEQPPAVDPSPSAEETGRLVAEGKEIFLERCAGCHNDRGDKPLKTGAPLNQRGLSTEVIAQAVNGRLRDRTEDERRAVTPYISSLMQNKDSGKK
jgi:mono/diheme cytochrome c family protein